ncbi:MAG: O-methyltransferase [Mycoplasmatota bacterium]
MIKMIEYAKENNIPIMEKEGLDFLLEYIKKNNIKSILEIGSAIGYSAINMALINENIRVVTVERDVLRYDEAIKNINKFNLNKQIEIYNIDAFDFSIEEEFDLIFIDAAKAQYTKFFEKFKINLNNNGVIITDNLSFHGLTDKDAVIESRNVRQLVRKINDYVLFLKENKEFSTIFYNVGDGVAVSKKKVGECMGSGNEDIF